MKGSGIGVKDAAQGMLCAAELQTGAATLQRHSKSKALMQNAEGMLDAGATWHSCCCSMLYIRCSIGSSCSWPKALQGAPSQAQPHPTCCCCRSCCCA
jgi:hypothetical protein